MNHIHHSCDGNTLSTIASSISLLLLTPLNPDFKTSFTCEKDASFPTT